MQDVTGSLVQAVICFAVVGGIRAGILYSGPKLGALIMGTPTIMLPLMAIQAWQGPPITKVQTLGSLASLVGVNLAVWVLRTAPGSGPLSAAAVMLASYLAVVTGLYWIAPPDWALAGFLVAHGSFILVIHRGYRPVTYATKGRFSDGLAITAAFFLAYFLLTHLLPSFVRGVVVSFPIGILATIYFVRRILPVTVFRDFLVYTHGSIVAGTVFVTAAHLLLDRTPVAMTLTLALVASLAVTIFVSRFWRKG